MNKNILENVSTILDSKVIDRSVSSTYEWAVNEPIAGELANYIPALSEVDPTLCGLAFATLDGNVFHAGDTDVSFSIQSISKIFGLTLAMQRVGDSLWSRVGMEPSGQPFNSIVQIEWEKGIPRNPFINAGAIVVSDILVSHFSFSVQAFLGFVRRLSESTCDIDDVILESELNHGNRNAALAYLMKSFDNINSPVDSVLLHYFSQCSLKLNCIELAKSLTFLANQGIAPLTGEVVLSCRDTHRINAILSTSGMYDQSGEFAFSVGLPAKSGVGGGIVAVVPGKGIISAWSPPLNKKGNSIRALKMVENLASTMGLSIF